MGGYTYRISNPIETINWIAVSENPYCQRKGDRQNRNITVTT